MASAECYGKAKAHEGHATQHKGNDTRHRNLPPLVLQLRETSTFTGSRFSLFSQCGLRGNLKVAVLDRKLTKNANRGKLQLLGGNSRWSLTAGAKKSRPLSLHHADHFSADATRARLPLAIVDAMLVLVAARLI